VEAIIASAERLAVAPFRGESHEDLLPGLKHVAFDQAVLWFQTDSRLQQVRVLAVFFGGQHHQRRMLLRLLQPG
jgi:plasmid stabilization system protein ParE